MEKLTKEYKDGSIGMNCDETKCKVEGPCPDVDRCEFLEKVLKRLCEYERTGCTPEEIAEFDKIYLDKCDEVNRLMEELEELKKKPQGDLISRKTVMELIESKCTDGCLGTDDTTLIDAHSLIDDVSDIPTAYDVDAVVEQLESVKALHEELSTSEKLNKDDKYNHTLLHGLCVKAIEIVRSGGKE